LRIVPISILTSILTLFRSLNEDNTIYFQELLWGILNKLMLAQPAVSPWGRVSAPGELPAVIFSNAAASTVTFINTQPSLSDFAPLWFLYSVMAMVLPSPYAAFLSWHHTHREDQQVAEF
jgi:hypothetical protein